MVDEDDAIQLRRLLDERGIAWNENVDWRSYEYREPFEAGGEEVGEAEWYVAHWEVGWSWWSETQKLLSAALGEASIPTTLHLHAWNGVAVPGEVENTMIGEPIRRMPRPPAKAGLLRRLFRTAEAKQQDQMNQMLDSMVMSYAGPYENLMVASGTRMLRELNAGIGALGLSEVELPARYEANPESPREVGECYLLLARVFLAEAMKGSHLCWWRK